MQKKMWEKIEKDKVETEKVSNKISRQMFSGDHTTMALMSLVTGTHIPRHYHPSEQYTLLLSGVMKMIFDDGETVVLQPGELVFIRSNVPHVVEAPEATVSLDFFGPRREDWISKTDNYLRG
jgi:quercetin dioxygenase-like cupin family protein